MDDTYVREMIEEWARTLQGQRTLADAAIAQVPDELLHRPLAAGTNSIAVIMQHVAGNLASRWTDFLTTDGEKPWRERDREFVDQGLSRNDLMTKWGRAWDLAAAEIRKLRPEDLTRTVTIRGEVHTVPKATLRSIAHASYHVGQIMMIARGLVGTEGWRWQTIAPGESDRFTTQMREKHGKTPRQA